MKITIYKKAKTGKIQIYTSWTDGADICSESGTQGGKLTPSVVTCIGKNIGKSNETTPSEQADLECVARRQKKLDKGYFNTVEEAQTEIVFLPMLAKDGQKVKITYPCDAQPKLDGGRSMALPDRMMSRGGKTYPVPHIMLQLSHMRLGTTIPDGELYIHGSLLEDTMSLIKKPKEGSEDVEYWIYDFYNPIKPKAPWSERKKWLERAEPTLYVGEKELCPSIKIVPSYRVNNEKEMLELHDEFVLQGFEGIILRTDEGIYELNARSSGLIKYKKFFDDEYEIIGYKEGIGRYVGCVIWRCITPEGEEFDVTPRGSIEKKKEWYKTADKQIGKELTVRYWNKTSKGIPAPAVGIIIRDYE